MFYHFPYQLSGYHYTSGIWPARTISQNPRVDINNKHVADMFTPTEVRLELRLTRSVLRQLPIRIINADKSRLWQGKGREGGEKPRIGVAFIVNYEITTSASNNKLIEQQSWTTTKTKAVKRGRRESATGCGTISAHGELGQSSR